MRSVLLFFAVVAVASAARMVVPKGELIKDHYIVVFRDDLPREIRNAHIEEFKKHGEHHRTYEIGSFNGFSGKMNSSVLAKQLLHSNVKFVEQDQVMRTAQSCSSQSGAVWNLDRITERDVLLDGKYVYDSVAGQGVTAFIVDTGIRISHQEFGTRATWGANFVDNDDTDCNGHGTHVAGTVGGTKFGVAKQVDLVAVKVLNCAGSGTNAGVIDGVEYVAANKKGTSVANMSLGGGFSQALNNAVAAAVKAGVTFVVAAGNSDADACSSSPASEPSALTVGSTSVEGALNKEVDTRSSFSNYGSCVHIFAPGSLIESAWMNADDATRVISGTSMASPHVCGAAALYLSANPSASPSQVKAALVNAATPSKINFNCAVSDPTSCKDTVNLLLYSACA